MDNGFLRVIFSVPEGMILGINYGGIDNLLNGVGDTDNRGLVHTAFYLDK